MMPGKGDYRPSISSSGAIGYNFPTVLRSACSVNVRYFPFDTQRCKFQLGSWSHHGAELDIENPSGTSMYISPYHIVISLSVTRGATQVILQVNSSYVN